MRSVCVCVLVLTAHPKPLLDSLTQVHARFLLVLLENNPNLASFFKVLTHTNLSSKFRGPLAMILRSTGQSATKQHKRSNRGSNVSILTHIERLDDLVASSSSIVLLARTHTNESRYVFGSSQSIVREGMWAWVLLVHQESLPLSRLSLRFVG